MKIDIGDAAVALAASIVDRTGQLITDGWVKGKLSGGFGNVEEFCIHGAMSLALEEIFGDSKECGRVYVCGGAAADDRGRGEIEAIASALIVDEAAALYGYDQDAWKHGSLGAASFNDNPDRKHEEVLRVIKSASHRLWDMAMDSESTTQRSWADVNSEVAEQFMHVSLAN